MILIATYQADPGIPVPVGFGSVLIVKINRGIPSASKGCESWNDSRSYPGGAGVETRPTKVALVSPAGSVSMVTPGWTQTLVGSGGRITGRSISLLCTPTPTLLIAFTK